MGKKWLPVFAAGFLVGGCAASIPTGPSVMVLPGTGIGFEQFQYDDGSCRQWALQRIGVTPAGAATEAAVGSAVLGTAVGAATGAAVGAASGHPGTGAAVGSGLGLFGGTAAGAGAASESQWAVQRRYDIAYMQCMYAKGHEIPVPAGTRQPGGFSGGNTSAAGSRPAGVPPPPPGRPPPPPSGPVW